MAKSFITLGLVLASAAFTSATCLTYGIDFQDGGVYFQNNASNDPFSAYQYFTGCTNNTARNILVDPQGNQKECSPTWMQADNQTQLINCYQNAQDTLVTGNWTMLIVSNNGNQTPIAYQRHFSLDVGRQSTTYVTPTVTVSGQSTLIETSTTSTEITITSTVPAATTTITEMAIPSSAVSQACGWTERPQPSVVVTTKVLTTYTVTYTEYTASCSLQTVEAQCTTPIAGPGPDAKATILPTILGALDTVAQAVIEGVDDLMEGVFEPLGMRDEKSASAQYKRAIIEGRQPTDEEKRAFVAQREARMAPRAAHLDKRHPDQRILTKTAEQFVTETVSAESKKTLTSYRTESSTITTTVSEGTATVYHSQQTPVTSTAPVPTSTSVVTQSFAVESTTVWLTPTITNTYTTTAWGAQASCALNNQYMH